MDLHVKFRPNCLQEIFGHTAITKSLASFKEVPHTFLFHGPSGTGKTTFSRIIATLVGCDTGGITEIDAATNTGVDDARKLMETLPYQGFGCGKKLIILDECHMLSKSAWNALLKVLEEPPPHVYFALCTTELLKIPKTIQTRCHAYELKLLPDSEIADLLWFIHDEEGLKGALIFKEEALFEQLVSSANGSPRQALVLLSACVGLDAESEINVILDSTTEENKEVIDFCRIIVKRRASYKEVTALLKVISKQKLNPESVRIQIVRYITACLLNARSSGDLFAYAEVLDAFGTPIYSTVTGFQDLILQFCNVVKE